MSMSNAKDWQSGLELPIAASHGLPMEWWGQNLPKQHILSGGYGEVYPGGFRMQP